MKYIDCTPLWYRGSSRFYFTYKIFGYILEIQNNFVFLNNSVIRGVIFENNKHFVLVCLTLMWLFLSKDTKWFPQKTWVSCELIRFWKYLAHIRLFNMITQGYCLQSNIFLHDKTFNLIENSRKGFEFLPNLD